MMLCYFVLTFEVFWSYTPFLRWTQNNINLHNNTQSCTTPYMKLVALPVPLLWYQIRALFCRPTKNLWQSPSHLSQGGPWLAPISGRDSQGKSTRGPLRLQHNSSHQVIHLMGETTNMILQRTFHESNTAMENDHQWLILYHTLPYFTILYHTLPYFTILYHSLPFFIHFPVHLSMVFLIKKPGLFVFPMGAPRWPGSALALAKLFRSRVGPCSSQCFRIYCKSRVSKCFWLFSLKIFSNVSGRFQVYLASIRMYLLLPFPG